MAEGLSFETVARIEHITLTTVSDWMKRAVWQSELIDQDLVQNIETEWVEMDEVYSFAGIKKNGNSF